MFKHIINISLFILFVEFSTLHAACTPAGTAGDDIVNCTGTINSFQYFYGGNDTVTLTGVTARTYNNSYWLDEALGGNITTDGNDIFIANNSQFYWVLGFNGDDIFDINNSEFNNAYADTNPGHGVSQRGNDTFHIENSTSFGYILGGNDNDFIEIIDSNVSNVASGYSNIYSSDYTPFDGNDTLILDNVNFTAPLYWSPSSVKGVLVSGRGDDTITFRRGGEVYYVYAGHGNDHIEVFNNVHFNDCNSSLQNTDKCGIYGDESYASELNTSMTPLLHGDDTILLHDGDYSRILIQGGDGSDKITIETPVTITDTLLDGGDDKDNADTFVDQLHFMQWSGDLNGSHLVHWEQIVLDDTSDITFIDTNIAVGNNTGIEPLSNLPYGLSIQNNATLNIFHDFFIDGNLHNASVLNLQDAGIPGKVVTISNDYTSDNGALYLDVTLNDASPSIADKLIVQGNTQGTTTLYINNINGLGGQTPIGDNNGILLIEVKGQSNATFQLSSVLHVGKYNYILHKGSDGNWYLQSEKDLAAIKLLKTVDKVNITKPEMLHYTIALTNTGNIALHSIEVIDMLPDASHQTLILQSGDTNNNHLLDLNEKWIYTTTFSVTQNYIDNGINITNKAKVTTSDGTSALGTVYTKVIQDNNYSFTKQTTSNPLCIGEKLLYTFTVKNLGNTRLKVTNITDDNCQSTIKLKSESLKQNGMLDLNEKQVYSCVSLPVTLFEVKSCKVINIANAAVKINLSNIELKEKTSKVTISIHISDPCPCETSILKRAPLMPSDSHLLSLSSTAATIQWKDNAFNETGFKIYKNDIFIGSTKRDKTSFNINDLQPRTTYTYIIKSYNPYGESYRTTITFTTKDDYSWLPAIYNIML